MKHNKPNRSLFSLEKSLFKPKSAPVKSPQPPAKQPKTSREKAQAFDSGEAIELQYSEAASTTINPPVESFSAADSFASELEDASLPFEVEAFDESSSFEVEAFDTSLPSKTEALEVEAFDASSSSEIETLEVETLAADEEVTPTSEPAELEPQPYPQPENQLETFPEAMEVQPAPTVTAKVVPDSEPLPDEPIDSVEQPSAVTPTTAQAELAQEELADAQAFAADLQAIINGEKTYDTEQKEVVSTASATQPAAVPTAHPHDIFDQRQTVTSSPATPTPPPVESKPTESEPTSKSRSHAVFEQMGKNMAHATEFNRGTVDLSLEQRFAEFDRL